MPQVRANVRSDGEYRDGEDHLYIAVRKEDADVLPYRDGERTPVELEMSGETYRAGIRSTPKQSIVYICPDLYATSGEKVRLVDALRHAGYARKDEVVLQVAGVRVRIADNALPR